MARSPPSDSLPHLDVQLCGRLLVLRNNDSPGGENVTEEQRNTINLWIRGLRSGRYKQGNVYLHNPNTDEYCAVGLLCKELQVPNEPAEDAEGRVKCTRFLFKDYSTCVGHNVPPWEWFQEVTGLPVISGEEIIYLNDSRGMSFEELASWLEEEVERVTGVVK